jgi:hypothetical protein
MIQESYDERDMLTTFGALLLSLDSVFQFLKFCYRPGLCVSVCNSHRPICEFVFSHLLDGTNELLSGWPTQSIFENRTPAHLPIFTKPLRCTHVQLKGLEQRPTVLLVGHSSGVYTLPLFPLILEGI